MSVTEPAISVLAVRRRGQLRTGAVAIAVVHADYPTFSHVFPKPRRRAAHALTGGLVADQRAFPTFGHCGANVKRAHPAEPHRYLGVFSVHPEHQRQRLGSRYLTPILERTDRDGDAQPSGHRRRGERRLLPAVRVRRRRPALVVIPGGPRVITTYRTPL
jgi:GNAT superfamily N-acetyltransferase